MANDMTGINDIYNNGLNAAYGPMPRSQNLVIKTGQTTSFYSGDDGDTELGLSEPANRFEEQNIGGDDIVIDHHTGLMWPKSTAGAACNNNVQLTWMAAIDFCGNLSFAGFDDWRMPNILESLTIFNYQTDRYYTYFTGLFTNKLFWSATTSARSTSDAAIGCNDYLGSTVRPKTNSNYVWPCRSI